MEPRVAGQVDIGADELVVLTKADCPKCEDIKRILDERKVNYRALRFSSFEAREFIRVSGIGRISVPSLIYKGRVYDSVLRALGDMNGQDNQERPAV